MKVLAALALLFLAGAGQCSDQATWMLPAVLPAVIPDGPFAGQGGSERALHILGEALPQFPWRYEFAHPLRGLHEIAQHDGHCSSNVGRLPEREEIMIFSNRPMVSPGYGVILREDRVAEFQPFLDASGAVDLDKLGEAKELSGAYPAGRPHYGTMKSFIDGLQGRLTVDSDTIRLFRQLKARRLDYYLGTRDEALYFAANLGDVRVIALPIAGMPRYGLGYIACYKGAIGEKVINAVDDYLADDAHWAAFIAPWARWLTEEDFAAALKSPVIRPDR